MGELNQQKALTALLRAGERMPSEKNLPENAFFLNLGVDVNYVLTYIRFSDN